MQAIRKQTAYWLAALAVLLVIFVAACTNQAAEENVEYPYGFGDSNKPAWYCRGYVHPSCTGDALEVVAGWDKSSNQYVFQVYYDRTVFTHRQADWTLDSPALFTNGSWTIQVYNQGMYK